MTDANLLLGRLGTGGLIGGRMRLDVDASRTSIEAVGKAIGIKDAYRVAQGIIDLAVAKMTGAIREISVQRGRDPREYALVCFGGAGPMHAVAVAEELGIADVIIPQHPGNFSALGLLSSDLRHDYVKTPFHGLRAAVEGLVEHRCKSSKRWAGRNSRQKVSTAMPSRCSTSPTCATAVRDRKS